MEGWVKKWDTTKEKQTMSCQRKGHGWMGSGNEIGELV